MDSLEDVGTFKTLYDDNEFSSLVAGNLMDIKTEMGLMRRNITSQVEGMVTRALAKQQGEFMNQARDLFAKSTMELKRNFSAQSKYFEQSMFEFKKEISQINDFQNEFTRSLSDMKAEISELKGCVDDFSSQTPKLSSKIESSYDMISQIENKLSSMESFNKNKTHYVENNLLTLNKKLAQIEKTSKDMGQSIESNKSFMENTDSKILGNVDILNKKIMSMEKKSNKSESEMSYGLSQTVSKRKSPDSKKARVSAEEIEKNLDSEKYFDSLDIIGNSLKENKFDKILEVESRIKKLNEMR